MNNISIINSTVFIVNEIYKESHYNLSKDILDILCRHNLLDENSIKCIEIIGNNEIQTVFDRSNNIIKLHTHYINDRIKIHVIVDTNNIKYDYIGYIGNEYSGKEGMLDKVFEKLIKAKDTI